MEALATFEGCVYPLLRSVQQHIRTLNPNMESIKNGADISALLGKQSIASSSTALALIVVVLGYVLYVRGSHLIDAVGLTRTETSNTNTSPQNCKSTRSSGRPSIHWPSPPTWRSRGPQ